MSKTTAAKGPGRPAVYTGNVKKRIVSAIRKLGLTGARNSLMKNEDGKGKLKISLPTLGKFAAEAGIELQVGRPAGVESKPKAKAKAEKKTAKKPAKAKAAKPAAKVEKKPAKAKKAKVEKPAVEAAPAAPVVDAAPIVTEPAPVVEAPAAAATDAA
jgi:hypothetical protein